MTQICILFSTNSQTTEKILACITVLPRSILISTSEKIREIHGKRLHKEETHFILKLFLLYWAIAD